MYRFRSFGRGVFGSLFECLGSSGRRRRSPKATCYRLRHGAPELLGRTALFQPLEERVMLDIGGAGSLPPTIVVGRTLSAYDVPDVQNNQETLTFTVYNQAADPITGVLLTDTLANGVTFASASQLPDQNGQQLAWSLGTIQPYDRASVTLTVSLASPIPATLDTGASAYGTLDAGMVTWSTAPATLRSTAIAANLLASTPDANTTDPYVQEKAAELNYDPTQIYTFLQTQIGYNSYVGSLRGARGTLWSNAGNSLDDASLGIALMRASGIPAQYEEGALSTPQAQQLILSMFPASYQTVGYIPPGTQTSDPANDPQLLSETKDHFWFQFDSGGGVKDADPGFSGQSIGNAATISSNSFADVPDDLRYKVEIKLNAEIESQGASLFGLGLSQSTVLDRTFNTVDLVGHPITVGNFVNSTSAGFILGATTITYSPYLDIGDEAFGRSADNVIRGTDYQEVQSNFPFASQTLTGLFLDTTTTSPGGQSQTDERTLLDRIGFAGRQSGAEVSVKPQVQAAINELNLASIDISPSFENPAALVPMNDELDSLIAKAQKLAAQTRGIDLSNPPNDAQSLLQQSQEAARDILLLGTRLNTVHDAALSDANTQSLESAYDVTAYFVAPRVIVSTSTAATLASGQPGITVGIDLESNSIRAIPIPGQAANAGYLFNVARGMDDSLAETRVLSPDATGISGNTSITTQSAAGTFQAAVSQGIDTVFISQGNISDLSGLSISAEAQARITDAVTKGLIVLVPVQRVVINGVSAIAWYQHDPSTGETIAVAEDGTHNAIVNFIAAKLFSLNLEEAGESGIAFDYGFLTATIAGAVVVLHAGIGGVPEEGTLAWYKWKDEFLKFEEQTFSAAKFLVGAVSVALIIAKKKAQGSALFAGFEFGEFVWKNAINRLFAHLDPPAFDFQFNPVAKVPTLSNRATEVVAVARDAAAGTVSGSVQAGSVTASRQISASWQSAANSGFLVTSLNASAATITDANGNVVGTGVVAMGTSISVPVSLSGNLSYAVNGFGNLSFYSSTNSGLGVSGNWANYTATATGNVVAKVKSDALTLNGQMLPVGTYVISTDSFNLGGSGLTTTPNFAGSATLTLTGSELQIGAASGSLLVAGASFDASNGIFLTGCNGTITIAANVGSMHTVTVQVEASNLLAVRPSVSSVTADQNTSASFSVNVRTSASDTYTLAVDAPRGWTVNVDRNGIVSLTPAPGAAPGTYSIGLFAQSQSSGSLIAAATIAVTVTAPHADLIAEVVPDPDTTVSFGGAEIPSAFDLTMQNTGPAADTYNLSFSNVPAGFTLLNSGTSVTVPAGQTGIRGLYLQPTGAQLPPPGTNLSFSVTATSKTNPTITQTANVSFTMPTIDAVTIASNPTSVTSTPGSPMTATVTITNVGNVTANAALSATTDSGLTASGLPSTPVSVGIGQSVTQTITLTPAASAALNSTLTATVNAGPAATADSVSVLSVSPHPNPLPEGEGATAGATVSQSFAAGTPVEVTANILSGVLQPRQALASYTVTNGSGTTVFTSTPVTIALGALPADNAVDLGMMATTGFAAGQYTIHVAITETGGQAIAGATGAGTLLIESPVAASLSVDAEQVTPGTSTVTSTLTVANQPVLGGVATDGTASSVAVNGMLAYVAGTTDINVVDVSDPASPQVVATFGSGKLNSSGTNFIQVAGNNLLVATGDLTNGNKIDVLVYSLANPTSPQLTGSVVVPYRFLGGMTVEGTTAYLTTHGITYDPSSGSISDQFGDVAAVDFSNPAAPTFAGVLFNDRGAPNGHGSYEASVTPINTQIAYVAGSTSTGAATQTGQGRILIINTSNPASMSVARVLDLPGAVQALAIAVDGNTALVVGSSGGFLSPFGDASNVQLTGNVTLTLLDLSDPANPQIIGSTIVTQETFASAGVSPVGKLDATSLGDQRFAINGALLNGAFVVLTVDASTPTNPAISAFTLNSPVTGLAVVGGQLLATSPNGLQVLEASALSDSSVTAEVDVPNTGATIDLNSFSTPPTQIVPSANSTAIIWKLSLSPGGTQQITWQSAISNLLPGQMQQVALGATIQSATTGTNDSFTLPGLNVVAIEAPQTIQIPLLVRSAQTVAISQSSVDANSAGNAQLGGTLSELSDTAALLQTTPTDTNLLSRTQLLLKNLSAELGADPALAPFVSQLAPIQANANSGDVADLLTALPTFFNNLDGVLAVEATQQFTVTVMPNEVDLPALANQQKTIAVQITDTGPAAVSLDLSTAALPSGVTASLGQSQITVQPGATQTVNLTLTSNLVSTKIFTLDVHAAASVVAHDGTAVVAVRAAAADVLSVTANPITVDAGAPVALSASIFNTANATRNVLAHIEIFNAANVVVASPADVPMTLSPTAGAVTFDLGAIDTSTLIPGVYTAQVSLRASVGSPLPGKTAEAPFLVGLPISASVSASPTTLPPGDSNVTTTITVSNSTTAVHAPVGDIVAFYAADNPYGIANTADGAVFVIDNTSPVNITNGVFTITLISGSADSFKVGLVPAGGRVIIEPGVSDDGQSGHTFFKVTGSLVDESESGPNDDFTRFEFTGLQGSSVIDSGVFTPAATRSPSESDPNYILSFLGGPGDHDAPNLDFLPKVVATLYDPPAAPSGGTMNAQTATPPISGASGTTQGPFAPLANIAAVVPAAPTPPPFNPPAGDAVKWIGAAGGNWNVAANWLDTTTNTNHVPDATDNVTIDAAGLTITVNTAAQVAQSLLVKSSTTLAIAGGDLTVGSGTEIDGTLTLANATFRAAGGLLIALNGGVQWTSGTIDLGGADAFNLGTMTLSNNLALAATNGGNTFNLGGKLINEGTIVQQAGSLSVRDSIEVDNTTQGAWQFAGDAILFAGSFSPTAVNNGVFQKTGGIGNSDIQLPLTSVDGTFEADSGTLRMTNSADTFTDGVFNAGAGATVNLNAGVTGMVFSGTFTGSGAGAVLLNGGTTSIGAGGATFDFAPGLFQWVNATINLQGNALTNLGAMSLGLANQGSGEAMSSRDANLNPLAGSFVNQGILTAVGSTNLSLFDKVLMNNTATGSVLFAGDGDIVFGGQTPSFTSAGTIEKTSGADISEIRVNFTYTDGPIEVDSGTLMFDTLGGQFGGTSFNVAAGATLDLAGSTGGNVFTGTFTGTGGGTVLLKSGSIVIGQSGVTFNFPAGMFQWTGGGINLDGHSLTNTGSMTLANPGNISLFGNDSFTGANNGNLGGTFNNNGTVTESAAGSLVLFDSVAFNNLAGAKLLLAGDAGLFRGSFAPTATNTGAIEKTAGSGTSIISAPFSNLGGTLSVDSGTLALAGPTGTSTGAAITVAAGATLDLTGGTDGNVYSGTYTGTGAGTVLLRNGAFEIGAAGATFNFPAGVFQWTGGGINLFGHILTNLGVMTLANANNVALYGNGNFNGGPNTGGNQGGTLDNKGTINEQGPASMQLFDSVVLTNEAGASINLAGGAGLLLGNSSPTISNAGAIQVTNGVATSTISVPLTNTGTVDLVSGELGLFSTVTNQGTLDAYANTLKFIGAVKNVNVIQTEGGTLAFNEANSPSLAVDNSGAIVVNGGSATFSGPVTQVISGFLSGGEWLALNGGSISLPANANIKFNEAKITLGGAGAVFNGIQPLETNDGSLSILGGASFTTTGNFTNNGPLTLGSDSTLSITGDYTQTAVGTLNLQLGGTPGSGHFGQLIVSGAATFAGLLHSELVGGYTPTAGDDFTVATYGNTSGSFAAIELAEIPAVAYTANIGASALVLTSQAATLTATQTTLTSSAPSGASFGQLVQYIATVTAPGGGTPTGAVQFQIDGLNSGAPVALSGGQITLTIALPAGSHTVTALYISDSAQFANSDNAAAPLVQQINATNAPASTVELYYTTFSPGTVDKVSITFDQNGLTLGGSVPIVQNIPADGLIFLPNGDLLTANGTASEINLNTGAVTSVNGQGAEHLSLDPSGTKVWTSPQPGNLVELPLNPLSSGIVHILTGDDTIVTHLAFDPAGQAYYVSSGAGGFGSFGLIDLTTFTTKRIFSNLPAAHGISYDPYTGDLFLVGALSIVQIDPRTLSIVSERDFPTLGSVFDQGANDGKGHIYVANNGGYLAFVDYSGTGLVGDPSDFVATPFLAGSLDDVAPLAGLGGAGIPVSIDHHLPATGYNVNPTSIAPNPASFSSTDVTWNATFLPGQPETEQFQLTGQVTNMAPGEVRQISTGTTVTATVTAEDGTQIPVLIQLPPVVVAAEHIIELTPSTETVDQGATATYTVELSNPLPTDEVYSLSIDGLPAGETAGLTQSINVPAGGTVQVPLTISVPVGALQGTQAFVVSTQTADGASDSVEGQLTVTSQVVISTLAVHLTLTPIQAVAGQTNPAVYTLTVTNTGDTTDTYNLAASLPAGFTGAFSQTTITVPPGISNFRDIRLAVTPPAGAAAQDYPFTVTATSTTDGTVASQATGTATVLAQGVQVSITPSSAVPGSTYQLKVTNTGQATDTFNLSLASPGALVSTLGTNQVTLQPGASQTVPITTGAVNFADQGALPLTGIATSQTNAAVQGQSTANLSIASTQSMTAAFNPAQQTLVVPGATSFLLQVNNTGNTEDSYSATIVGTTGPVTANLVGLDGQPTQSVPLFILPGLATGAILLQVNDTGTGQGTVTVLIQSLTNGGIQAAPTATVTVPVPTTPVPTLTLTNNAGLAVAEGSSTTLTGAMLRTTDSDESVTAANIVYTLAAAPAQGSLALSGQKLASGGTFTQDDIYNGRLAYEAGEEGADSFDFSVSAGAAAAINGTFLIAASDPEVIGAGGFTLAAAEGSLSTSQTLATFTDPGGAATLASYSAQIDWGDGSSGPGALSFDSQSQVFTVQGQHIYVEQGAYPIVVTLGHEAAPSVTVASSAQVSDPSIVGTGGYTIVAVAGSDSQSQTVATFVDPGGAEPLGDYSAVIHWGDGSSSAGAIAVDANTHVFTVTGDHLYATAGTLSVSVALHHESAPDATAASTAQIAPVSVLGQINVVNNGLNVAEGASANITTNLLQATVTGGETPPTSIAVFTVTAAPTSGSLTLNGQPLALGDSFTQNDIDNGRLAFMAGEEGADSFGFKITAGDAGSVSGTFQIAVNDSAVVGAGGFTYSATEGAAATVQTVAAFTDPGGAEAPANYSASINWGDGASATPGTISVDPNTHIFTVSGQHSYAQDGAYSIQVVVSHESAPTATVASAAQIAKASTSGGGGIAATAVPVTGYERSQLTDVTVASFTEGDGTLAASAFAASIDWGDGVTSSGSVALANGVYTVTGSHEYPDEGHFAVRVGIDDRSLPAQGGATSATVGATATIHEELLEEGTAGTPDQNYIQEIYRDLFGRQAEPQGRDFWTAKLTAGASRHDVAYDIVQLAFPEEFQKKTVAALYRQFLGRAPDAVGEQTWTDYLYNGGTIESMSQLLVSSPEYFKVRAGGSNEGFLKALFQDALGRDIDPAALAYFEGLMAKGATTADIAGILFNSDEYHRLRVDSLFEQFMDRPADTGAEAYFALELDAGATDELVISQMMSSDEYFAKSQV